MCLTSAIISAPGTFWLEGTEVKLPGCHVILDEGLNIMCSVNIFHLNKRLGRRATPWSNVQAVDQRLQTFIGVGGYFCFTGCECHLKSFSTGAFCNRRDLLVFARWIPLEKTHISQASLYLQMINKLFYLTVSSVFGRTSVKSVLTVSKPFKWLPWREHSGYVLNNKLSLHKADFLFLFFFNDPLWQFKAGKRIMNLWSQHLLHVGLFLQTEDVARLRAMMGNCPF